MIISIEAEKAFDKIQVISDENSPENEHRGNLPQYNKSHILQTHN